MLRQTANMQTGDAMDVDQYKPIMVEELEGDGVNAGDGTCPIKTSSVLLSLHFTSTHPFFPSFLLSFFPSSLLPFFTLHLSTHMQTGDAMDVDHDGTIMVEELEGGGVNAGDGTCPINTSEINTKGEQTITGKRKRRTKKQLLVSE
jgi:hypothetical protein